jgi:hypothetical protein
MFRTTDCANATCRNVRHAFAVAACTHQYNLQVMNTECCAGMHWQRNLLLDTAQELAAEASGAPMLLTKDNLERALMARLMDPPDPYPQWPIAYLCASPLSRTALVQPLPAFCQR